MEVYLALVIAAWVGFICGAVLAATASSSVDVTIEKRGVWTIKDRAYRLTKIEPYTES